MPRIQPDAAGTVEINGGDILKNRDHSLAQLLHLENTVDLSLSVSCRHCKIPLVVCVFGGFNCRLSFNKFSH